MTEQTNAELIAEARSQASQPMIGKSQWRELDKAILTIRRLAAALEAADQRAAEYAAVVEKVRFVIERESGWFRYRAEPVSTVLATAPADALREVKAEVWEEGEKAGLRRADYEYGSAGFQVVKRNPYREEQS